MKHAIISFAIVCFIIGVGFTLNRVNGERIHVVSENAYVFEEDHIMINWDADDQTWIDALNKVKELKNK